MTGRARLARRARAPRSRCRPGAALRPDRRRRRPGTTSTSVGAVLAAEARDCSRTCARSETRQTPTRSRPARGHARAARRAHEAPQRAARDAPARAGGSATSTSITSPAPRAPRGSARSRRASRARSRGAGAGSRTRDSPTRWWYMLDEAAQERLLDLLQVGEGQVALVELAVEHDRARDLADHLAQPIRRSARRPCAPRPRRASASMKIAASRVCGLGPG